jgi:hypothetical protein
MNAPLAKEILMRLDAVDGCRLVFRDSEIALALQQIATAQF